MASSVWAAVRRGGRERYHFKDGRGSGNVYYSVSSSDIVHANPSLYPFILSSLRLAMSSLAAARRQPSSSYLTSHNVLVHCTSRVRCVMYLCRHTALAPATSSLRRLVQEQAGIGPGQMSTFLPAYLPT